MKKKNFKMPNNKRLKGQPTWNKKQQYMHRVKETEERKKPNDANEICFNKVKSI